MSVNNQMYSLFNTMKEGYANERYDVVESAARCWLMFNPENPFKPESPEYEAFFQMQRCFTIWRNGEINGRINKKRMLDYAKQLCSLNPKQPYKFDKAAEERELKQAKEAEKKAVEQAVKQEAVQESLKEEKKDDINYLLDCMYKACSNSNDDDYEMYALHLMDVAEYNPFILGTNEYELFSTMKACYAHTPQNLKRMFAAGKQLCKVVNGEEEKQVVLGVLPDEKKSWLKFLFPWKKEGGSDDSQRSN